MNDVYAFKLCVAFLGSLVGVAYVFHAQPISRYRFFLEYCASVVLTWAVMDNFFYVLGLGECVALGFAVGFFGSYTLKMLQNIAPNLAKFSFRAWVAWVFRLELPENVFDEKQPEQFSDENRMVELGKMSHKNNKPSTEYRRNDKK